MSENPKVSASHRQRAAIVYVRQSTLAQLERNRESTTRQYDLADKAVALGWPRGAVQVVDEDQGISGSSTAGRPGFAELAAQVGLGQVGIVLALEVSRLARNNADWYRLLDLAGMTDTLIADADGLYHPGLFNDRLVLGMKGTMSEAELHILRARLDGGVRSKAARGELKRALPVGLVWGEGPAEVLFHPDDAVTGVIAAVFEQFGASGSARAVWLWLREQGLKWPLAPAAYLHGTDIRWVEPTYHAVHSVLTHPAYAGAYVYGRTKFERRLGDDGQIMTRRRVLPREQWQVLIEDHHPGYIDWDTYLANTEKIAANTRPVRHKPGTGAIREGCALLQGLAACGICGRKLAVFYQGPSKATPGYYCTGTGAMVDGRGTRHLQFGGVAIDAAVAAAFLAALAPAALSACLAAVDELEHGHDSALAGHRREVERTRYDAAKAGRRYRAVDPDNRLVARGLEADWEKSLAAAAAAAAELARREKRRPTALTSAERASVLALGDDLDGIWAAPTTAAKDRKQLLHTLLDEVVVSISGDSADRRADLQIRWKGGAISELTVGLKRAQPKIRTSDDTIELIRRLACHHTDAVIAGILNRQGRRTARGLSYTASRVQSLRHHWDVPCYQQNTHQAQGELVTVAEAAAALGLAPSTLHRWLGDGFIAGEQTTPGAPWRILMNDELRALFTDHAPAGWLAMLEATLAYGVSRQTLLQRVKRGQLRAVHVRVGRRKGLRIEPPATQEGLF
jgi:DNA invertase Pin-like site-specific DNA recombinase